MPQQPSILPSETSQCYRLKGQASALSFFLTCSHLQESPKLSKNKSVCSYLSICCYHVYFSPAAVAAAVVDCADAPLYLPYKSLVSTISSMVFSEGEAHRLIEILSEKVGIIQDTWHTVWNSAVGDWGGKKNHNIKRGMYFFLCIVIFRPLRRETRLPCWRSSWRRERNSWQQSRRMLLQLRIVFENWPRFKTEMLITTHFLCWDPSNQVLLFRFAHRLVSRWTKVQNKPNLKNVCQSLLWFKSPINEILEKVLGNQRFLHTVLSLPYLLANIKTLHFSLGI